ncbi:unnamed protein product [Gemmataceae bacterium]|nr:unnamed protein product [Gemmataceae bacterium]VTT97201.1 unnamed protein product [Gemmataceae bacterium]
MASILWLFDTCGLVVAPAMWLAGAVAIALCVRATRRATAEGRRLALRASLAPFAVGVAGVFFGLAYCAANHVPADPAALLKVTLAGLVVTLPALVWSLSLRRPRVA